MRSYFLNEIDGLKSNDGIFMVGSTNHLERLDPGISVIKLKVEPIMCFKMLIDTGRNAPRGSTGSTISPIQTWNSA